MYATWTINGGTSRVEPLEYRDSEVGQLAVIRVIYGHRPTGTVMIVPIGSLDIRY